MALRADKAEGTIIWNLDLMNVYDVIIIGGGPGGVAAGVYTGRKLLNTLLITDTFGGQSFNSNDIENWIGEPHLTGLELAKRLEAHVRLQETVDIKQYVRVSQIERVQTDEFEGPLWDVTAGDETYRAKAVIVTSGGRRRKLDVPGEKEFEGKGVVYCSTCDAPLFKNKTVVVTGSGNAAQEGVIDLLAFASKIYLLIRGDHMKGDEESKSKVEDSTDKVSIIYHGQVQEIQGEQFVTGVTYLDKETNALKKLDVDGVFVEVGSIPNSDFLKGVVELDEHGQVLINHRTGETSEKGIFAAGAVADQAYDQNNISVGDAIKAALTAHQYVVHFK